MTSGPNVPAEATVPSARRGASVATAVRASPPVAAADPSTPPAVAVAGAADRPVRPAAVETVPSAAVAGRGGSGGGGGETRGGRSTFRPAANLTEEMEKGKEPMRSFADLKQLLGKKNQDDKKS